MPSVFSGPSAPQEIEGLVGAPGRRVSLVRAEPDIASGLGPQAAAAAERALIVETRLLGRGVIRSFEDPGPSRRGVGYLVLDGLMTRHVGDGQRWAAELLGPGSLLSPWHRDDEAELGLTVGWQVWDPLRLAVLDRDFVGRCARFPSVIEAMCGYGIERAAFLSANAAIASRPSARERLELMLWHLASRWGRVRPDGVLLPLRVTHALLGALIGARRPSVTTSLGVLEREGRLMRTDEGYLLLGDTPDFGEPAFTGVR